MIRTHPGPSLARGDHLALAGPRAFYRKPLVSWTRNLGGQSWLGRDESHHATHELLSSSYQVLLRSLPVCAKEIPSFRVLLTKHQITEPRLVGLYIELLAWHDRSTWLWSTQIMLLLSTTSLTILGLLMGMMGMPKCPSTGMLSALERPAQVSSQLQIAQMLECTGMPQVVGRVLVGFRG